MYSYLSVWKIKTKSMAVNENAYLNMLQTLQQLTTHVSCSLQLTSSSKIILQFTLINWKTSKKHLYTNHKNTK